ncbi:RNA methyltransferase [Aerococcus urinaehominis]|uniref:RNA methyltransferase n=1 Tax=Aerococcus urinaehominis TaxID=128944 RepID=A0A0X8FL13_9LACT|nr:23S rRNA (guanosine(2251)-2'-O)-methyltransferase RlmB [Aerococcus urinaehominis]AMB99268.1 RNA methyltransferase [Aerococcus urinaehominis]SDM47180.1 23S rRNA (guanosine2251-2'-O)-methyltransferase [Aerococcus urinaehominis]
MTKDQKRSQEDFIYGIHAVNEAMSAGRPFNKLFVQDQADKQALAKLVGRAKKEKILVNFVPKKKLNELTDHANHQGVVAAVAAYEYADIDDMLALASSRQELPFILILDGIEDPHNLGSILRTADACGVHGVIIPNRRAVGLTQTVAKTSTGAIEHVPVARVTNLRQTVKKLKAAGVWVFGTDMQGQSYWEMQADLPLAIVIGNEGKGISPGLAKELDGTVTIPMVGHVQSLNASVACALISYKVLEKRQRAKG